MNIRPHINELAKSLKEGGVRYAFGVAGSGASLELITALLEKGVKYYPVAHEGAAAIMAGACSRDGKTRGVAISIKGPGFVNLIPGITANYFENRPAITISEAYGPSIPSHKMHKRVNHYEMSKAVLKGFVGSDGNEETTSHLFGVLESEIPGPGHIELYNEPEEATNTFFSDGHKRTTATPTEIPDSVLESIKKSKRPALILGSLATRALRGFDFSSPGIPVATTAAAKGAVDESSPIAAGVITGEVKELSPENNILGQADLIIGIGLRNTEVVAAKPFEAKLVIIDDDVDDTLHDGFEATAIHNVPNMNEDTVRKLSQELKGKEWGKDEIKKFRLKLEEELFGHGFMPSTAFRTLQTNMGEDATLVLDTGLFCVIGETIWKAASPEGFIGTSIGRFMGTGIPTAIGTSISNPGKPVMCVMGDGGVRPYLPEIKLAVSERLSVIFILMSDNRYGSIACGGILKGLSKLGFDIENASWFEAVSGMGCESRLISKEEELNNAINSWKKEKGPMFLELSFDQDKYLKMTDKLR